MEVIPLAFCLLGVAHTSGGVWQPHVMCCGTTVQWVANLTEVQMNMDSETDVVFEYLEPDFPHL